MVHKKVEQNQVITHTKVEQNHVITQKIFSALSSIQQAFIIHLQMIGYCENQIFRAAHDDQSYMR